MTVTFENKGWLRTRHQAVLLNDDTVLDTAEFVLKRKRPETLTYDLCMLVSGQHNLTIGGHTFALDLYKPAAFTLLSWQITPQTVQIGEKAKIRLTVLNTGEVTGQYDENLYYNGQPVAKITDTVPAGQETVIEAELIVEESGRHQLTIAGQKQDLRVLAPARIVLSELRVTQQQIAPGEPVMVDAVLINSGDLIGSHTVELLVNEVRQKARTVTLNAGQTEVVSFAFSAAAPGTYDIQIGDKRERVQVVQLIRPRNGTLLDAQVNSGSGRVTLINHEKTRDAVFVLTDLQEPERPLLVVYVHADSKSDPVRVKDGTYAIYCTTGQDFDAASGRFMTDARYYRFDDTINLTTTGSGSSVHYSVWTAAIGREDGNTPAKAVHEHVFPQLNS